MFAVWAPSFATGLPFRSNRLVHAVEVAFERIDVLRPEPAELIQPGVQLLKWLRFQPVETALSVPRGFHEAGVAQHAEVLRYGRLGHAKLTLDLANGLLGGDQ